MIDEAKAVYAESIGIESESDLLLRKKEADWFYNICEVIECADITGKRLAEISSSIKFGFDGNLNSSIEVNSILIVILNLIHSFSELFFYEKNKHKKRNLFQLKITISLQETPTFNLLYGLRNALIHRHPINMRHIRFLGSEGRMGVMLSPVEFGNDIRMEQNTFANLLRGGQIRFVREQQFTGCFEKWFAWEDGKTLCFLDCEDLGKGVSDFLFELFLEFVERNDNDIKELLMILQKIGTRMCTVEKHIRLIYLSQAFTLYNL